MPSLPTRLSFLALFLIAVPFALEPGPTPPGLLRPAGGIVALVGGTVIDGTGTKARPNCTVVIDGERILAVGPDVAIPEGAEVVDVSGRTLVPGLIDMHGHLTANLGGRMASQLVAYPQLYLAGGVTTVFSPGDADPEATIEFRDAQRRGEKSGTRVYCAGPYFDHTDDQAGWMGATNGPEAMVAKFREWEERIDGVKVYTSITPIEFEALVGEADEVGLTVTGHLTSLTAGLAIDLGIDRLEHGLFAMSEFAVADQSKPFDLDFLHRIGEIDFESGVGAELIDKIVESGTVLDPTTVIFEWLFSGSLDLPESRERYLTPQTAQILEMLDQAFESMRQPSRAEPGVYEAAVAGFIEKQYELVRRVHERGGVVVCGTDPVFVDAVPGYALHREVEHLVLAGLTELEALRACTLDAATAIGLESDLGSIEAGKLADLVVIAGSPEKDIRDLRNTHSVYQAGALFSPQALRDAVVGTIE